MRGQCGETRLAALLWSTMLGVMLSVNGTRLRVVEEGSGPPLVLLHGGPGVGDYTAPLAALLNRQFRVVRFDQRGCGASHPTPPFDLQTLLADLEALRVHIGAERWLVAGHSWGADVALAYALSHPERTDALLHLSGTGVQNDRDWKAAYEAGRDSGHEVPGDPGPVNDQAKRSYLASWRAWIKAPELLRRLADCPVPALVLTGSDDIRPNWPNAQLAALLPNGEFEVIPGAAHTLWATHAEELEKRILSFIARSVV